MFNPAAYTESFAREAGSTEAEWLRWLPAAIGDRPWHRTATGALVNIDAGTLALDWRKLPERRIALVRMPRLEVRFRFQNVPDSQRQAFMQRFDLYMQRGGG